jgi:hypothetical protein
MGHQSNCRMRSRGGLPTGREASHRRIHMEFMPMTRLERKHSLFHWTNVPVLAVMIWSGLLIFSFK